MESQPILDEVIHKKTIADYFRLISAAFLLLIGGFVLIPTSNQFVIMPEKPLIQEDKRTL